MFTWMNKQGVRSDEGFEVQFTGRFTAEYREGKKYLFVEVESSGNGLIDFASEAYAKWANSSIKNGPEDQARMRKNFLAALEFQGLKGIS